MGMEKNIQYNCRVTKKVACRGHLTAVTVVRFRGVRLHRRQQYSLGALHHVGKRDAGDRRGEATGIHLYDQ